MRRGIPAVLPRLCSHGRPPAVRQRLSVWRRGQASAARVVSAAGGVVGVDVRGGGRDVGADGVVGYVLQ